MCCFFRFKCGVFKRTGQRHFICSAVVSPSLGFVYGVISCNVSPCPLACLLEAQWPLTIAHYLQCRIVMVACGSMCYLSPVGQIGMVARMPCEHGLSCFPILALLPCPMDIVLSGLSIRCCLMWPFCHRNWCCLLSPLGGEGARVSHPWWFFFFFFKKKIWGGTGQYPLVFALHDCPRKHRLHDHYVSLTAYLCYLRAWGAVPWRLALIALPPKKSLCVGEVFASSWWRLFITFTHLFRLPSIDPFCQFTDEWLLLLVTVHRMSMHSFVDCAATGLPIHGALTLSLLAYWMLMYFIIWVANWDFVALYSLLFYSFAIFSRRLRFTALRGKKEDLDMFYLECSSYVWCMMLHHVAPLLNTVTVPQCDAWHFLNLTASWQIWLLCDLILKEHSTLQFSVRFPLCWFEHMSLETGDDVFASADYMWSFENDFCYTHSFPSEIGLYCVWAGGTWSKDSWSPWRTCLRGRGIHGLFSFTCSWSSISSLDFGDHHFHFHANFHTSSACSLGWQLRRHSAFY